MDLVYEMLSKIAAFKKTYPNFVISTVTSGLSPVAPFTNMV